MMDALKFTYIQLLKDVKIKTYRYLYSSFNLKNRLTGIIGARGTGKTTLMLQYIKNNIKNYNDAFYVSADHIYFNTTTLFEFVRYLYEDEGVKLFFIDEIHKYKNWNQELKNIYDSFPKANIVFSGSSSIDLIKGSYDLSRRAVIHRLSGMSFREYYNFKTGDDISPISFSQLINDYESLSLEFFQLKRLKVLFKEYLQYGYYPFVFEGKEFYYDKLLNVIEKTIFEDIANFYNLKTENLVSFKKLLSFLATIPPGNINIHNLAKNLKVDDKTALHYVTILKETGLVLFISTNKKGTPLLRNPEKILLENTSLYHCICYALGHEVNKGTLRELFFNNALVNANQTLFYQKTVGDYMCNDIIFEVGGKTKTKKQIQTHLEDAFLVKDDVLLSSKQCIPLYLFGFLY